MKLCISIISLIQTLKTVANNNEVEIMEVLLYMYFLIVTRPFTSQVLELVVVYTCSCTMKGVPLLVIMHMCTNTLRLFVQAVLMQYAWGVAICVYSAHLVLAIYTTVAYIRVAT